MFDTIPLILAQEDAPPSTGAPAPTTNESTDGGTTGQDSNAAPQRPGGLFGDGGLLFVMIAVLLLFMVFSTRSQRAERKKREAMLAAMKKGDRVQTIGGIVGTVIEVRDNEVLLKVDENSNTRIRFARTGIQSVLQDKE